MSIRFLSALSLLSCALLGGPALAGEWKDESLVTQNEKVPFLSRVAVGPDDTAYALWPNWENFEDTKVTLTKSTDRGATWSTPAVIFNGAAFDNVAIHADEAGVHVLLLQFIETAEDEFKNIFYSRSTDGGTTFSTPVGVESHNDIESFDLFSDSGVLYVYGQNGDGDNFLFHSADGQNWWEDQILLGVNANNATFTARDGVVHMAYRTFTTQPEIGYARSVDQGKTWSAPVAVSNGGGAHCQRPRMVVADDGSVHVVWEDNRLGQYDVMYSSSSDGATWSTDLTLNDTAYGVRAAVLADESGVHVAWTQYHGVGWPASIKSSSSGIVWSKHSTDGGTTWSTEQRVSQNEAVPHSEMPDKGADDVQLVGFDLGLAAFWSDERSGSLDIYMRNDLYRGQLGPTTAQIPVSTGGTADFDLASHAKLQNVTYFLLGGVTGAGPGLPLPGGATLPVNYDIVTALILAQANGPMFQTFAGTLDAAGAATARFDTLGPLPPVVAGVKLTFAYVADYGPDGMIASNPVEVELVP